MSNSDERIAALEAEVRELKSAVNSLTGRVADVEVECVVAQNQSVAAQSAAASQIDPAKKQG